MNWFLISLYWYFFLFFLGFVFSPLTKKIFNDFYDFGYPFAKTLAILFLSYVIFIFGIIKVFSFTQLNLIVILLLFCLFNLKINKTLKKKCPSVFFIIFEELLFLISFIFWVYVRGQEPSIHGLEKFMDFGFINSILKTKYFPPIDMWLSSTNSALVGLPINYYYFGHLTGAVLIKLTGVLPAIGYNLILATIFALAITTTFSFVFNLGYLFLKNQKKILKKYFFRLVFVGLLGSFIVNLGGNLHTIYVLTRGYPHEQPVPFWQILSFCNSLFPHLCQRFGETLNSYWYPNATRFIPFTIHEFPSYSYVVADLHGHVFDIPFVLLTLTILFLIFINKNQKPVSTNFNYFQLFSTIFIGFLTAIHYMTNAFDGPIYLLLTFFIFFIIYGLSVKFFYSLITVILFFIIFSFPCLKNLSPNCLYQIS